MTIHDEIDNYLAADLHNELSDDERSALHSHLVDCADCRKLHQETKIMNKVLEENLADEKPDLAFEQRMLANFRDRVPQRSSGIVKLLVDLMRLRATQITAVAALLLALVQVGKIVTGEKRTELSDIPTLTEERMISSPLAQKAPVAAPGGAFDSLQAQPKSDDRDRKGIVAEHRAAIFSRDEGRAKENRFSQQAAEAPAAKPVSPEQDKTEDYVTEKALETAANTPQEELADSQKENASAAATANRKLIRNATVELEIVSFEESVQKITAFANESKGYVATTNSDKQANGKLRGTIVVKVAPENLDSFLQKIRGLGDLKNQTLGTEDITKAYFDTESRLKNARVMESRLIEMLKKKSDDINDLLQVEKELGRVREQIEQMQGELKFWDSQVQLATVTIQLSEKDLEEPAAFLLKERAQLALYTAEVEKIYNDIKALASAKVQITNAQLDRDNTGRVSARMSLLIAPEESETTIAKVKSMGRVENFQVQTDRVAQGGNGMSESAKTKRDKVQLNVTISRDEQEQSFQQTSLSIRTSNVDERTRALRDLAEKQNGRVRSSTFSRDPNNREFANVSLRVPMKNYNALMESLSSLGEVENVSVQRQDNTGGRVDEANAPADVSIQVYSQGNIVAPESGVLATLRRTVAQSAGAIMWSLRMIGVAIAFLAPWLAALIGLVWLVKRIVKARRKS